MAVVLLAVLAAGCGPPDPSSALFSGKLPIGRQPDEAVWIPASTQKICQLTGQLDRQAGGPTLNETGYRFGLSGTDLGASFEYRGHTQFLFGDTEPTEYFAGWNNLSSRSDQYNDSIAYTLGRDPERCLVLQFVTGPSGAYASPRLRSRSGRPIGLGTFEVPISGFGLNDKMYVFFALGHLDGQFSPYVRSVLGVSGDGGRTFTEVREFSSAKFVNVWAAAVDRTLVPGLPPDSGSRVLLVWGSEGGARYRASRPYLAVLQLSKLAESGSTRYFAGFEPGSATPRWSRAEDQAAPLFESHCVGELSVQWNPGVGKWLMLYGCQDPRGISLRQAALPWGPWSEPQVIFDGARDGDTHFIHQPHRDDLSDPGHEEMAGGEYAPFFLPFFRQSGDQATIYYVMSTWNPYQTVLMKSRMTAPSQFGTDRDHR
jgi:hypothetical protein